MTRWFPARSEDAGYLLLRLGIAGIVLFHGAFKLAHGVEWIKQPLGALHLPGVLAYGTYLAEVVAPVFIVAGYWTRVAALLVAFDMFMAIVLVLRQQVFAVKDMGGGWGIELEALLLVGSAALFFTGAGKYSLGRGRTVFD